MQGRSTSFGKGVDVEFTEGEVRIRPVSLSDRGRVQAAQILRWELCVKQGKDLRRRQAVAQVNVRVAAVTGAAESVAVREDDHGPDHIIQATTPRQMKASSIRRSVPKISRRR